MTWLANHSAIWNLSSKPFLAVASFVVSLLGMFANLAWGLILSPTPMVAATGPLALAFTAAIVLVAVLLVIYARAMARLGALR